VDMFIRKRKNKSGTISVVVVNKSKGGERKLFVLDFEVIKRGGIIVLSRQASIPVYFFKLPFIGKVRVREDFSHMAQLSVIAFDTQ